MPNLPSLKVHRRSLDRRAADVLREEILSGRFPPGFRLVETWLAQQLHVSRGTVRAALAELAHQGLVEQVAYTKWSVPDLRAQDAWELYTLRASLEGLASYLAAEAMTTAGQAILKESFDRLSKQPMKALSGRRSRRIWHCTRPSWRSPTIGAYRSSTRSWSSRSADTWRVRTP